MQAVLVSVAAFCFWSCSADRIAQPLEKGLAAGSAAAAKTSTALAVTSATPSFGDRGTTLDVHVLGSGFTAGAQATWLLNGTADAHVHTNSTIFVSSSELVANITIASDAQIAFWDVQVSLSNGKNGVGSDLFEVTTAQVLGSGTPGGDVNMHGANELGQAVGYTVLPITAFMYDPSFGIVNLGTGQSSGLDPLGTLVVGRTGSTGHSTAWVRQSDNTWPAEALPTLTGSVGGNATSVARAPDGTLIVGGWDALPGAKKTDNNINRPVLWRRTAGEWSAPQLLPLPAGFTSGSVYDVNGNGQAVGRINEGSGYGIVWDTPTSYTVLNGTPFRINAAGTLIVGAAKTTGPAYWWRDPGTGSWNPTPVTLPSLAGAACGWGTARSMNRVGVIVGDSCNAMNANQTIYKAQATVWVLDLSGPTPVLVDGPTALPGLGALTSNDESVSSAAWVTDAYPYQVTGGALENGTRLAVRWTLR